jgi:alginate O-acetyltransferase complex protein AlgJ
MTTLKSEKYNYQFIFEWVLIAVFWIIVTIPLVGFYLPNMEGPGSELNEKRALNPFPKFKPTSAYFQNFPKSYEAYFNDHFGFRDILIKLYNYIHVKALGISPVPGAIIGKDGWLYWTGFNTVNDYRGKLSYSLGQLIKIKDILESRTKWLKQRGVRYFFVVSPNKWMIYPEFLPFRHNIQMKGTTRFEQLKSFLSAANADVKIVDLKEELLKAKQSSPRLYYKTDTHWNELGAFIAYKQLMRDISSEFPGIETIDDSRVRFVSQTREGGDLANLMGATYWYSEENTDVLLRDPCAVEQPLIFKIADKYSVKNETLARMCPSASKNAIVFRDSFFTFLRTYFAEHFNNSYYIWTRYNQEIVEDLIDKLKPDIIVDETVDIFLTRTDDENSLVLTENLMQQSFNDSPIKLSEINPENGFESLKAINEIDAVNSENTYAFNATGNDCQLEFPSPKLSANQSAIMEIVLTAPENTSSMIYYMTKENPQLSEANTFSAKVHKGENKLYFYFNGKNLIKDMRFDPGTVKGNYEIHKIEVRLLSDISVSPK